MPGYWKPTHEKGHGCVLMTLPDSFHFSEALRKAFPRIRFVREDYSRKFRDYAAWKAAIGEAEQAGRPSPSALDFTRDPGNEWPDYFSSLGDVLEDHFCVWVEPRNWRPRWRASRLSDSYYLANLPKLNFYISRGGFAFADVRRTAPLEGNPEPEIHGLTYPPFPLDTKEIIDLRGGRISASWFKGHEAGRRFVHKVWRILDKMSTNRLVAIKRGTTEPIPPDGSPSMQQGVRALRGALSWARARRHNYLSCSFGRFKPAGYFDKGAMAKDMKYRR